MAIDYKGQTANIIYDEASNQVITIHPGGARQSTTAGSDPAATIARAQSNINKSYTNVGNINVTQESGASDRLAAESEVANAAARAKSAAAGPSIPPKLSVSSEYSQYVGQKEGRVVDGIEIPKWVDDDYLSSYVTSVKNGKPRRPNSRELTELQAGVPLEQLYSTMSSSEWSKYTNSTSGMTNTGLTEDTRDWNKILSKAIDPTTGEYDNKRLIAAASEAKAQLYGGISIQNVNGSLFYVGGNGTVLTGVPSNFEKAMNDSMYYGINDFSGVQAEAAKAIAYSNNQIDSLKTQLVSATTPQEKQSIQNQIDAYSTGLLGLNSIQKSFTPDIVQSIKPFFDDASDIFNDTYVPAVSKRVQARSTEEQTDGVLGVVEQTIVAPEVMTPGTTNVAVPEAVYQEAPQAAAAVPVTPSTPAAAQPITQTPYTPLPTTTTGQPVPTGVEGTGVYPQAPVTGTMATPLQTAGLSAVPKTVQVRPDYTGTTMANLTSQSQQGFGGMRTYENKTTGQQMMITVDASGNPLTYVPPNFTLKQGYNDGGSVRGYAAGGQPQDPMLEAKFRIASMNGYSGPKTNASLDSFAKANPNMTAKFRDIGVAVAKGGYIRKGFDEGGLTKEQLDQMMQGAVSQTMQPQQAPVAYIQPQAADFVPVDAGQATPIAPFAEAATVQTVQQANQQDTPVAQTVDFTPAYQQVQAETADLTAAQGQVAPEAQVTAAQQQTSAVTGMQAAQGAATMVDAPAAREIQAGEIISGVADAEKAALFNEQIQAATATPSKQATVAGQLEGLMQQFEGGETPAWAAGSMRTAMATLSARGLGASSMAGQAVIQATMEAALPIAQMDAQVQAQFEGQNLSNRQQRAMLAAQQRATFLGMEFDQDFQARVQNSARIGDIANMNFTAEQSIALENSRAANTMNLSNLNNRQAMVMAEAAALSQLDTQNLNNRQQAAVQNAQSFMQMDMTNLANEQQTAMFKSQQNIQALFTDQAAENAGKQFNASSQNQTDQYFANLRSQTSQFNASQQNAMDQFNVNSVNALREFNSEIQQQRDLFNAQNGLVIAQSNAQWRQNLSTLNTAAQNQSNSDFAKTMNALTASNMDQIWQRERDLMSFAFAASESSADRAANIAIAKLTADEQGKLQDSIGKGKLSAIAFDAVLGKWL